MEGSGIGGGRTGLGGGASCVNSGIVDISRRIGAGDFLRRGLGDGATTALEVTVVDADATGAEVALMADTLGLELSGDVTVDCEL
ncbi:MAG: hypothetical protein H8K04_05425 [Nitrospira sp.]